MVQQNWEENFPTILGLERKALKLVRDLFGLLFVKNQKVARNRNFKRNILRELRVILCKGYEPDEITIQKLCTENMYLKPRIKPLELSI